LVSSRTAENGVSQPEVVQFRLGEQPGPDQEPDAVRGFDGEAAAAAGHDVDGQVGVLPVLVL
jgi:hypothetical protein